MTSPTFTTPKCNATSDCTRAVTHIDPNGYVYCEHHGLARRSYTSPCRKLRRHELNRLHAGEQVKRY
jgi:hypothetical protein